MFTKDNKQYTLKYIIVGDSCVGKSCLLLRLSQNKFENTHDVTIGVEFGTYTHMMDDGNSLKLQIWDTAGQENFRSITRSYYRNSVCALVVFDITKHESYKNVAGWINDIKKNNNSMLPIITLIGNKCDLLTKRQVTKEEAERFAKENGITYIETSAKLNHNVKDAFVNSIPQIYKMIKDGRIEATYVSKLLLKKEKGNSEYSSSFNMSNGYCSNCY